MLCCDHFIIKQLIEADSFNRVFSGCLLYCGILKYSLLQSDLERVITFQNGGMQNEKELDLPQ